MHVPFRSEVFVTFEDLQPTDVTAVLRAVQKIGLPYSLSVETKSVTLDEPAETENACAHFWLPAPRTGVIRCAECGVEAHTSDL